MKKPVYFIPSKKLKTGEKTRVMNAEDISPDIEEAFKEHQERLHANWWNQFMSLCQAIQIHGANPMDYIKTFCENYEAGPKEKKDIQ